MDNDPGPWAIGSQFCGSENRGSTGADPRVRLYRDHVLVKEAATRQRTPWHRTSPTTASKAAPGFPFDSRRRVLSVRYLSDEIRHATRRWRTTALSEGLEAELVVTYAVINT